MNAERNNRNGNNNNRRRYYNNRSNTNRPQNRREAPKTTPDQSAMTSAGNANSSSHKKPLPSGRVLSKYDNLLEQHLIIRRKYFEQFDRVSLDERRRLEQRFFQSITQLREFENSLEDYQKEVLARKTDGLQLDLTYSSNHELPTTPEAVPETGNFDDPHLLLAQKNRQSFKDDREESEGTYEDYKRLKGLY